MVHFYDRSRGIGISKLKLGFLLLAVSGLFLVMFGCKKKAGENTVREIKSDKTSALSDKPLAGFQNELLNIAFETATSIPAKPYIKDRSKAQEEVVATCLKLDQPKRAMGYIEKIEGWRRGACYADLAFYCAQHGDVNVQHYLDIAGDIAEDANIGEEWRKDRIKVKIAQTHALLGNTKEANEFEAGVVDSESGKVTRARAMVSDKDSFDEQMKMLDTLISPGVFDTVKNALESATELFNRFYEDTEKRSLVEDKIKSSLGKVPVFIRIELLTKLAGFALDHSDKIKAIELVNETQLLLDGYRWPPEQRIAHVAKLTKLRFRAGDFKKASTDANAALALFNNQKENILNLDRAGAIRPIAEAYQSMGNMEVALSVYKQAVEEGIANPNFRPRAEDLSATCCSMALYAVEPDAGLWMRIRQIHKALGNP